MCQCAVWEIYHCAQAFEGMMEGQICLGVCEHALRPDFADDCPEPYATLTSSCWHQDPLQRYAPSDKSDASCKTFLLLQTTSAMVPR